MSTVENLFYLFGTISFFSTLAFAYYAFKNARLMQGPLGHQLMAVGGVLFMAATIVGAIDHFFLPGSGLVYVEFLIWIAGLSVIVSGGMLRVKEIQRVYRVSLFRILTMMPLVKFYLTGIAVLLFISLPISTLSVLSPLRPKPRWFNAGNMLLWAFAFAIMAMAERRLHLAVRPSAAAPVARVEEMLLREDILALRVYSDLTNRLLATAIPAIGAETLRDVLSKCADEHDILKDCEIADEGTLIIERTVENLTNISEKEGIPKVFDGFSSLLSRFIDLYSAVASHELAQEMLAKNYQATKERYGDIPIFPRILKTMPEGFLEEEKLPLLSREELEAKVKERTKELEEALIKAREASEALRASKASFHNIVERSADGIIIVDRKGIVCFVNPAAESLFGRKAEELVGELFGFPIVAGGVAELDIIRRSGEKGVGELRVVETEWEGEIAYLALLRDITERKRAEERLRESEERFRTLVTSSPIGLSIIAKDGTYEYVNPAFTEIFGYTLEDVSTGKKWFEKAYPDPEYRQKVITCWIEDLREAKLGETRGRVFTVTCKDGSKKEIFFRPASLADGRQLVTYEDITERVRREEMLRALNAAAAAVQRAARAPEAVFTAVMEQLQALGLTGAVALLDETREQFIIRYVAVASLALARAEKLTGLKAVGYPLPVEQLSVGRQVLAGESVFVPNVAALLAPTVPAPVRPLMPKAMRLLKMPRGVVAPLSIGEEIIGFLGVSGARMTEADVATITAFANQMSAALENAQLFEATQRRWREAETLRRAAAAVTETLSLDETLERILEQLEQVVPYDSASIQLLRDGHLEIVGGRGFRKPEAVIGLKFPVPDDNPNTVVVVERKPLILADAQAAYSPFRQPPHNHIHSWLGMPLIVRDQVIGMLTVDSIELEHFNEEHIQLVTPFANQAAIAVENARLYEQTRKHLDRLSMLYEVGKEITSTLDLDALLQSIADQTVRVTGAERSLIWLVNAAEQEVTKVVGHGYQREYLESLTFQEFWDGLAGWVFREKTPTLTEDTLKDERAGELARAKSRQLDTRSVALAPLLTKGEAIGILAILNSEAGRVFDQADLDLITMLASQVSIAIENARLFEAERGQRELAEALEEAAAAVSSTLDPDQVLDRILEQVERVVAGDVFNIMLIEDDIARAVRWRGYECLVGEDFISHFTIPIARYPSLTKMVQSGKPIVVPDTATDPDWVWQEEEMWMRSYVGAPILVSGVTVGVLNVGGTQPGQFGPADARRLQAFADHAAAAIGNARLFEQAQQEIAERKRAEEELQHTLEKLRKAMGGVIQAMALAVETKDAYTAGHQQRVANLARAIATEMGLSPEQIEGIRMAGVIHDLGKISIPAEILSKPIGLSDLEHALIRAHSQVGYDILKEIEFPWPVAQIVLQHHERMDGSGYPQGLVGDDIILEARILAVADVVEAMASHRPYRPPCGLDKALEEISQNRGVLYDPEVVDACLRLFTEKGFKFE